jgi:hypothetical protein
MDFRHWYLGANQRELGWASSSSSCTGNGHGLPRKWSACAARQPRRLIAVWVEKRREIWPRTARMRKTAGARGPGSEVRGQKSGVRVGSAEKKGRRRIRFRPRWGDEVRWGYRLGRPGGSISRPQEELLAFLCVPGIAGDVLGAILSPSGPTALGAMNTGKMPVPQSVRTDSGSYTVRDAHVSPGKVAHKRHSRRKQWDATSLCPCYFALENRRVK